ncbi:unnamed protein product [Phaeothamnion confervicola]
MYGVIFVVESVEITASCVGLEEIAAGAGAGASAASSGSVGAPPSSSAEFDAAAVVGEVATAAAGDVVTDVAAAVAPRHAASPAVAGGLRQRRPVHPQFGPLSGQIISAAKSACRAAFLCCPARLVEAHYRCSLQCDQAQLGNMYAVLSRRRGRVTNEDLVEGTQLFLLDALLPVAESFGFAGELFKRTSGGGTTPQLSFSHWEVVDVDPFWRPLTEEEREDEGEGSHLNATNVARRHIDAVRRRKGLATADKIVMAAEKQRTLTRNK